MNKSAYTSGQFTKWTELLTQHGVLENTFNQGLTTGILSDVAEGIAKGQLSKVDRNALRKALGLPPISMSLELDFDMKLSELIRLIKPASVQYEISDMAKGFATGRASVMFHPIKIDRYTHVDVVQKKLRRKKLFPATTFESLWFIWKRPEILLEGNLYSIGTPELINNSHHYRRFANRANGLNIELAGDTYDMNRDVIVLGVKSRPAK